MNKGSFYFLLEKYFIDFPDPSLEKNKEVFEEAAGCTKCGKTVWREAKGCEAGNIFKLQDKYSSAFNLKYTDKDGSKKVVLMGCYGMGTSRLMGVIVEKFNDEKGIIWPEAVAPFKVHLIALKNAEKQAGEIYQNLLDSGVEVLYDDRDLSAGIKFADSDLIGIPVRVVVSEKTLAGGNVEVKKRAEKEAVLVKISEFGSLLGK